MAIKVVVFDFDGTLIDSNQLKHDAFFQLFPVDEYHHNIISDVLKEFLEESRYVILLEIVKRIGHNSREGTEIEDLAAKYNDIAVKVAKTCKETPGAQKTLQVLSNKYHLYLSSTTPQEALEEIVKHRNLDGYFCKIFGYPHNKITSLREIIQRESVNHEEVLVVGDGESDKVSALETGCCFFEIDKDGVLQDVLQEVRDYL